MSAKKAGTSYLPKGVAQTPKGDIGKHRGEEAYALGTFSGCETMTAKKAGWHDLHDDSKGNPFPAYKSGGRLANAGDGEGNNVECDVNVGSGLAPKKASPFKDYAAVTKPPQGRTLPHRGEHN